MKENIIQLCKLISEEYENGNVQEHHLNYDDGTVEIDVIVTLKKGGKRGK